MSSIGKVYEIVDATSDEQYFTLGVWLTLAEAIKELEGCNEPADFCAPSADDNDGVSIIEIREREIGWSDCYPGKVVYTKRWIEDYDEERDEYAWKEYSMDLPGAKGVGGSKSSKSFGL